MKATILLVFLFTLLSCGKDDGSRIPDVFVDYKTTVTEFNLNSDQNDVLLVNGHGVAGLIIYQSGVNTYKAFDRCSSVEPEKKCQVVPNGSFTATDPCSGAMFSLQDGSPAKAPAVRGLKEYRVQVINNFNIRVSNDYGN
jgi:nitrite reductase/ring-hydroxylating ferredoxin subunit